MRAYRCSANWTRIFTLVNPIAYALLMEDVFVVAVKFGYHAVVCVLAEANGTLLVCVWLPSRQCTVLRAG